MKKKKFTNKEFANAIEGLINNFQILYNKQLQSEGLNSLYLEYKKETEKFGKFVKGKTKEFEEQQRSGDKEGA